MAILAAVLAAPLLGLMLLLVRVDLDGRWEHHPSHFWLVLVTGLINLVLGVVAGDAARRRGDARLVLVSLSFMSAAGFLGLHALATPGVLLPGANAGFVIATPIGLFLAAGFAATSSLDLDAQSDGLVRRHRLLTSVLLVLMLGWAVISLSGVPPLDQPLDESSANVILRVLAVPGIALYVFAAWRYLTLSRNRGSTLPLALCAAYVLLAEAMLAVTLGRSWHTSWWEWHVLMLVAFAIVAWSARVQYRLSGSATEAFGTLSLARTMQRIDEQSRQRLGLLRDAIGRGDPSGPIVEDFVRRQGVPRPEALALAHAAHELQTLEGLFSPYVPTLFAERLRADPELAELGGVEREVSVLFADLQGFTAFSDARPPAEVIGMLNRYWSAAVPVVTQHGGDIERFAGDAILVVFNGGGDQPDHARRAVRAALGLQRAAGGIAEGEQWPQFRVGVNTGVAIVGNVGTAEQRSFTAIGDTTNLASRLQSLAAPGEVVIGERTKAEIGADVRLTSLGPLEVKGKFHPVMAYVVRATG